VARRTSAAAAERDVIRHCHSGLDVAGVQQQVLRALRRLMPVDAAFFATADPETLLFTSAYAEEPLAASTPRFLDNEFGGGDVNTFASLATSATHVASLDGATRHDRFASGRYSDIMRPIGLGDELRAALVARSTCWGYLCLHRADDPRGFSEKEAALITRLGPHIAHALRQAMLLHPAVDPGSARPGVILLADDLSVVATTPDAEHLMSLIDDGSPALPLPVAVYAAASALGALERGSPLPATLPSARVRTSAGHWLNVHASRLQGRSAEERRIAVVLEPAQPHATTPTLLDAHGLTPRETDVARLVLRGESTRAISDTLHITTNTVQDHLKAIFDKTGVRSRRALVGLLLGPPPPRVRAEPTSGTSVGT
jgi:DNA-binding CsgD family transcriptional regulator